METHSVRLEDESFLYRLYASTRKEEMKSWGWERQAAEAFLNMQFHIQQQSYRHQYPDAEHRLIFLSGSPIGQYRLNRGMDEHIVVDISLLPSWRNVGIGTERLGFIPVREDEQYVEMMWRSVGDGSFRAVV